MWRGLPSELPAGIDDLDYTGVTYRTDNARIEDEGDHVTSTYPVMTTPYYSAQFSVPRKALVSDLTNTRLQEKPRKLTKANAWDPFEKKLQNADAELERVVLESLNTANKQPRYDYEER